MTIPCHPNESHRFEIARQLQGVGLEFGPGCHPLPVTALATVRYVDAFDRPAFAESFPEVGAAVECFPEIDLRIDFDKEYFVDQLGKGDFDFVIANHVLEHLVNPLRFLAQVHALLRPEGLLYLAIPDKRRMFDRDRRRTSLADVVARYHANETVASEARIAEFVRLVERPGKSFDPSVPDYAATIDLHRRRSLHINVWIIDDIIELLTYLAKEMGLAFELHDGTLLEDEFLLLLRKSAEPGVQERYPITLGRLWAETQQRELRSIHEKATEKLLVMDERLRETQNFLQRLKRWLRVVPGARWLKRPP